MSDGVLDGLRDSIQVYGSPMVFTALEYEGVETIELLRPVEFE